MHETLGEGPAQELLQLLANPFPMGTANNCINCIDVCIDIDVFYNICADNLPYFYFLCKIKDLKYKFNFFDEKLSERLDIWACVAVLCIYSNV